MVPQIHKHGACRLSTPRINFSWVTVIKTHICREPHPRVALPFPPLGQISGNGGSEDGHRFPFQPTVLGCYCSSCVWWGATSDCNVIFSLEAGEQDSGTFEEHGGITSPGQYVPVVPLEHVELPLLEYLGNCLADDRLYGLVVRVLGYRPGGPGLIPSTTRKKK
jgi:hypothetical protein